MAKSFFMVKRMYYAEIMFLEGAVKGLFVLFAACFVLRFEPDRKKLFFICFLYGIVYVFYPIAPVASLSLKYLFCPFTAPLFCLKRSWKNLIMFSFITLMITFFDLHVVLCCCGTLLLICIRNLPRKKISSNKNYYECEVDIGGEKVRTVAFFDSGNRVFGENGEPVVLADRTLYNRFKGAEKEIYFSTLTGSGISFCRDGKVSVLIGNKWTEYDVKVALSPKKISRCGLILHGDMTL